METIALNDLAKICRVCLKNVESAVELADVAEMIEYCTNDKVQ